jgi:hypothetical protein
MRSLVQSAAPRAPNALHRVKRSYYQLAFGKFCRGFVTRFCSIKVRAMSCVFQVCSRGEDIELAAPASGL